MENHASVAGWQKLFFSYKCLLLSATVAIATFEIYGWKFSGSACAKKLFQKLITWSTHAKGLLNDFMGPGNEATRFCWFCITVRSIDVVSIKDEEISRFFWPCHHGFSIDTYRRWVKSSVISLTEIENWFLTLCNNEIAHNCTQSQRIDKRIQKIGNQAEMLLESKSAVKKLWAIRTIGEGRSFHGKRRWASESQCLTVIWERYQQRYGSGYM